MSAWGRASLPAPEGYAGEPSIAPLVPPETVVGAADAIVVRWDRAECGIFVGLVECTPPVVRRLSAMLARRKAMHALSLSRFPDSSVTASVANRRGEVRRRPARRVAARWDNNGVHFMTDVMACDA